MLTQFLLAHIQLNKQYVMNDAIWNAAEPSPASLCALLLSLWRQRLPPVPHLQSQQQFL